MDQNQPKFQIIVRPNVGVPPISNWEKWIRQVSDGAPSASVRIEAVENIGRECRDHQIFQRLGWIVDSEAADLAVRRAIVRILPEWGSPFVPYAIVRALSLAGVRPAAVETLDKMGPVTGEKEPRLVAQLASLRTGVADPIRMSGLPGVFGRDYRVLKYLHELVQTGTVGSAPWRPPSCLVSAKWKRGSAPRGIRNHESAECCVGNRMVQGATRRGCSPAATRGPRRRCCE